MISDFTNQGVFATYIFDLGNLILCNLIVYLIYRKIKIDTKIFCLLISLHSHHLFNSQLIPLSTFPDQGTYISDASEFRNAFFDNYGWYKINYAR